MKFILLFTAVVAVSSISWARQIERSTKSKYELPNRIDWREQQVVPPVKQQAPDCDASFYFAAIASLESVLFLYGGIMLDLSIQSAIDCSQGFNGGCAGGGVENTLDWISNYGVPTEESYPYIGSLGECKSYGSDTDHVYGMYMGYAFIKNSEEELANALVNQPVAVTLQSQDLLEVYKGGVLTAANCLEGTRKPQSGLVVGYNTTEDGQDYWIVQFSYGTTFGEDGYVWVARNKGNACEIANMALVPYLSLG